MRRISLALALLLLSTVCSASGLDVLEEAETQWRSHNVRSYQFQYRLTEVAFALEGRTAAVTVKVTSGKPAQMVFAETQGRYKAGRSVPKHLREYFPASVEALFELVRSARQFESERDIFTAYNPTYAFPERHFNRSRTMEDDDDGFVVTDFRVLDAL